MPVKRRVAKSRERRAKSRAAGLPVAFKPGWLTAIDGRTSIGLVAKATHESLLADIGGDPSTQQAIIAERVTWLHLQLQRLETEFARTGTGDTTQYATLSNALMAALRLLGIKRQPRDVDDLRTYLSTAAQSEDRASG